MQDSSSHRQPVLTEADYRNLQFLLAYLLDAYKQDRLTNDKIIYTVDRLTRRIDIGDHRMIREWIDMACSLMPRPSVDDIPLRMTELHVPC